MHCFDFDWELDFDLHLDLDLMELYFDFDCLYVYLVDFDYKVCQLPFGFLFGFGLMLIVVTLWLPGQAGECQKVDPEEKQQNSCWSTGVARASPGVGLRCCTPKKILKVIYTVRMKSESDQIMTCLGLCCM